jgi:hypothetical protein
MSKLNSYDQSAKTLTIILSQQINKNEIEKICNASKSLSWAIEKIKIENITIYKGNLGGETISMRVSSAISELQKEGKIPNNVLIEIGEENSKLESINLSSLGLVSNILNNVKFSYLTINCANNYSAKHINNEIEKCKNVNKENIKINSPEEKSHSR